MQYRHLSLLTIHVLRIVGRAIRRRPQIVVVAGLAVLAHRLACGSNEITPNATHVENYSISGTGQGCRLMKNDVNQYKHAKVLVDSEQYVKLVFTRSPTALSYFHFDDGGTHYLISATPASGSASTVTATFDIPTTSAVHVDAEDWTADTRSPPCIIKVTIERE